MKLTADFCKAWSSLTEYISRISVQRKKFHRSSSVTYTMLYFSKIVNMELSIYTHLNLPEFYCINMKPILSAVKFSSFSQVVLYEYTLHFSHASKKYRTIWTLVNNTFPLIYFSVASHSKFCRNTEKLHELTSFGPEKWVTFNIWRHWKSVFLLGNIGQT